MTKHAKPELESAFAAVQSLPEPVQEAMAAEILERVQELSQSNLTEAQRAEVRKRLSSPPRYADPETVRAFFRRRARGKADL
jgi:hypothetical protein